MTKEFEYTFEELQITPENLHQLLGFENNEVPEPFSSYIHTAITKAPELCEIKGGYKVFNSITINTKNATIQINSEIFSPAKIVITQLKQANSAALFLCTAGAKISEYANKISTENDPILGYVFDVLGSVIVEKATDKIQADLLLEVKKANLAISDRYSPGYCNWSVGEQQKLFALLPLNFCGIKLSDSSLMHPIKSVSGIIGIGEKLQQKGYQCEWCTDKNCIYGKIKRKK